jgi:hypothetical protein
MWKLASGLPSSPEGSQKDTSLVQGGYLEYDWNLLI